MNDKVKNEIGREFILREQARRYHEQQNIKECLEKVKMMNREQAARKRRRNEVYLSFWSGIGFLLKAAGVILLIGVVIRMFLIGNINM